MKVKRNSCGCLVGGGRRRGSVPKLDFGLFFFFYFLFELFANIVLKSEGGKEEIESINRIFLSNIEGVSQYDIFQ